MHHHVLLGHASYDSYHVPDAESDQLAGVSGLHPSLACLWLHGLLYCNVRSLGLIIWRSPTAAGQTCWELFLTRSVPDYDAGL